MCPRQESNLHLSLRRAPFYPLNYKDIKRAIRASAFYVQRTPVGTYFEADRQ